jgi:hypothetical protein
MIGAKAAAEPKQPTPRCHGHPMRLVKILPGFGPCQELLTYRCDHCRYVETIEAK